MTNLRAAVDHLNDTVSVTSFTAADAAHQEWIDMADHVKTNPQKNGREVGSMRSEHYIPESAGEPENRRSNVDITAMIRSLQRTEGLSDCFRRGIADCDQLTCAWRQYCLSKADDRATESES